MRPILLLSSALSVLGSGCTDSPAIDSSEPPPTTVLPSIERIYSEPLEFGSTWCGMSYDGESLLISSETGGEIWAAPHDLDGTQTDREEVVASRTDAGEQQIADHAQIFRDGMHLITFSVAGEGQGGDLFLLALNAELERVSLQQLVADDPPTNDMFMVQSDNGLGIGLFLPEVGHRVLAIDDDLIHQDTIELGGGDAVHANGAGGVYVDDRIHILAPYTLAPGINDRFVHLEIGGDWELLSSEIVHRGDGELGMVSALSYLPEYDFFVAHYSQGMTAAGGDIVRLIFDSDWNLLDERVALEGTLTRPTTQVIDDRLYLCSDGTNAVHLAIFELVDPP